MHFRPKILLKLRFTYETTIFRLRPLGRPFRGPDCPKRPFLSPKTLLFGLKSIFCGQPKQNCYNHDGTPQRQPFLLTALQGGLRVGVSIYLPYIYLKQPSLRGTYSLLQWKICIKTGQNVPDKSNRNATTNFFFKY